MGLGTETKHRKASPGGGPGRRLMAALMSVVLVASQAVGLLAPAAPAFAATGQQQIRCRSALHYGPFGVTGVFEAQGGGVLQCSDAHLPSHVRVGEGYKAHDTTGDWGWFFRDPANNTELNRNLVRAIMWWGPGGPRYESASWGSDGGLFPSTSVVNLGDISEWDRDWMLMHILMTDMRNGNGDVACTGLTDAQVAAVKRYVIGFDHPASYDGEVGGWATPEHWSGGPYPDSTRAKLIKYSAPGDTTWLPAEDEFAVYFATSPTDPSGNQTLVGFEYNPRVSVTFTKLSADARMTAGNSEYALGGAEYELTRTTTGEKTKVVLDANGHADLKLAPNEVYTYRETKAPKGYKLDPETHTFRTGNSACEEKVTDDPGRLFLHIQKKDSATKGDAQAGATLEGAEFEISYPYNGTTQTKRATTNANGNLSFRDIPFGTVTVRETRAPRGYRLDPTVHTYHVTADSMNNAGVVELTPDDDYLEDVIAFNMKLVKYLDTGNEGSGLQNPGRNISFEVVSNTTGQVVATMTTDDEGRAELTDGWYGSGTRPDTVKGCLPYDAAGYTVREVASTVPSGFSPVQPWQITPDQMVDGTTLSYIVDNDRVESHVQIVKTDAESGQVVALAGFEFQLFDAEGNRIENELWYPNHTVLDTFVTDGSGMVTLPEGLQPGTYTIREVKAQAPYLLNGKDLTFEIAGTHETAPVTVVRFSDDQAKGRASIEKTDAETGEALAGATFHVYAKNDVVSPDGRVQAAAGQLMTMVTTDAEGRAETGLLPLGTGSATYSFVETQAPDGYVLDATPHEVTLTYKDDKTPVVTAGTAAENAPNHLVLSKVSATSDKDLSGATFALWPKDSADAAEEGASPVRVVAPDTEDHDIRLEPVDVSALVLAGDVADGVSVSLVSEDGSQTYSLSETGTPVAPGTYRVALQCNGKEAEASGETSLEVSAGSAYTLNVADVDGAWEVGCTVADHDDSVALSRVEGTEATWEAPEAFGGWNLVVDGETVPVAGAVAGIADVRQGGCTLFLGRADGVALRVDRLLTDSSGTRFATTGADGRATFDRLGTNARATTYEYAEVAAPVGYVVDRTVSPVTAAEDGRVEGDGDYLVTVADEPTKVDVSKVEVTGGPEVPGATLTVTDSSGTAVDRWVSGDEPHRIEALAPGEYTLTETMTPRDHDMAADVTFTVTEDGSVVPVEMVDEPIEISGELDKRQQVADPVADDVVENGDGENKADVTESEDGVYTYTLDHRSTSNTWCDEYTVEDPLEAVAAGLAELDAIHTGVAGADFDGKANVWYRTNLTPEDHVDPSGANQTLSDGHENPWLAAEENAGRLGDDGRRLDYTGWRLWKADVPTCVDTELKVADLGLGEGERVTGIRLEYGRVEAGFTSRPDESTWTREDLKDDHDDITQVLPGGPFVCPFEGHTGHGDGSGSAYGPIQVTMRVNGSYIPETALENSANVFLARNGGDADGLEDSDEDRVVQTPKVADIEISGRLDKRQQIADPVAEGVVENGDGANRAAVTVSDSGEFDYTLDFQNTSTTWVDEFTVTDELTCVTDGLANLKSVTTPQAWQDHDGLLNVWYATDMTDRDFVEESGPNATMDDAYDNDGKERRQNYTGWHLWKAGIPAADADTLEVSDLKLAEGEHVTAVRFEYGRVEAGFTTRPDGSALWQSDSLKAPHDDFEGDPESQGTFEGADGTTRQYMPAVLTCEVTDAYVPGADLKNEADLYVARTAYGRLMEDDDEDSVVQTPRDQGKPIEVAAAEHAARTMLQTGAGPMLAIMSGIASGGAVWYISRKMRL